MGLDRIFGISGSALNAQTTRLNTIASNLANAGSVANNEKDAFRAKRTVFQAVLDQQFKDTEGKSTPYNGGVRIASLVDDPSPIRKVYEPGSPVADKEGYIYTGNVNEMTEMVEMMAASRSYQNNVEVVNTARQLMMRTVDIIRS